MNEKSTIEDLELLEAEIDTAQLGACTRTCEGNLTCAVTCAVTAM
ncbi:hypothetical protein [Streptomyces globisporus]